VYWCQRTDVGATHRLPKPYVMNFALLFLRRPSESSQRWGLNVSGSGKTIGSRERVLKYMLNGTMYIMKQHHTNGNHRLLHPRECSILADCTDYNENVDYNNLKHSPKKYPWLHGGEILRRMSVLCRSVPTFKLTYANDRSPSQSFQQERV
jgi:hypothetical protein